MTASRTHWRLLIAAVAVLMAAAFLTPRWLPKADLQENRVLAPAPAWPKGPSELKAFREAADAYIADHFPARAYLIGALNRLRMLGGVSGSPKVIVGRDGWLYYDDGSHMGAARGEPPVSPPELRTDLMTLAVRTEAMQARGVAYLVVVPPMKETIYPQHTPAWFHGPNSARLAEVLPRLADQAGAGNILYLHAAVARATARGETTYSRHDTHWTGYGAYAGYGALMDRMHALDRTEGPRPLTDFQPARLTFKATPRDLAKMLGVGHMVRLDFRDFHDPATETRLRTTFLGPRSDWTAPQVIDTGETGKPVLLLQRDSFSLSLVPFLYSHFSRIVLVHSQDGFWRQDLIDAYKPDIVVLEVLESGLRFAVDGDQAPSAAAMARINAALASR